MDFRGREVISGRVIFDGPTADQIVIHSFVQPFLPKDTIALPTPPGDVLGLSLLPARCYGGQHGLEKSPV